MWAPLLSQQLNAETQAPGRWISTWVSVKMGGIRPDIAVFNREVVVKHQSWGAYIQTNPLIKHSINEKIWPLHGHPRINDQLTYKS